MADRRTNESIKLIDPVKVVEELKRREEVHFDGFIILHYKQDKGLVSIREEYSTDGVPEEIVEKARRTNMFGKMTFSYQNGLLKKQYIQRQIPLEDFYL